MAQNRYETKLEVHKVDYFWVIHDFDFYQAKLPEGQSLKSPVFYASTELRSKWYLQLHLKKTNDTFYDTISLFLSLDSTSECKEVLGKFEFFILNDNDEVVKKSKSEQVRKFVVTSSLKNDYKSWGFRDFIRYSDALPSSQKLRIKCEVTFSSVASTTPTFNQSNSIEPQSNVSNFFLNRDLRKLFANQEFTDVTIYVKNKEFRAHKLILKARSPVFAAMFKHEDMEENQKSKVVIADLNELVVEEMLNYIYTDRSENLGKLADGLLAAAEKYGLDGLKKLSQDVLIARLSVENAIDTLILSDLHQASEMKSSTISYIVERSAVVMKTTAWRNLSSMYPNLVVEVCDAVTEELHSGTKKSTTPVGKSRKFYFLRIGKK